MSTENIQELFRRTAERLPAHAAISAGGRSVSYGELDERSDRIARTLLRGGAGKGTIVAILAADSARVIEAILGVLKAGCVFVPLDPRTPETRLAAIAAIVTPSWYLGEPDLAEKAARMAEATGGPAKLVLLAPGELSGLPGGGLDLVELSPEPEPGIQVERGRDELCYIYFTSGSTGEPKGIAGRLKGIDHFIRWEIETLGLGEGVRVSQLTSPAFDAYLRDVFVPFCAGGATCIPPRREPVLSGSGLVEWLEAERINVLHCVPSVFRSMLEDAPEEARLPDLRYVLMAGEPLLPVDVGRWVDRFGERIQLVNLYGPSETTMTKLCYFVQPEDRHRKSIPIGKPIRGARAVVLDGLGRPCPDGTMGEIYIRTPYRSLGYFNRPDLTREVFVPNPLSDDPADIVYKTGDFGRVLADGNFEFLGRKDHQVKIRGVRVELAEVENALRAHPGVQDVVVVARDGQDGREGQKRLYAYVVLAGPVPAGELREHCARQLPEVMVPGSFIPLDCLPRTLTGKVDRAALPDPGELEADEAGDRSPRSLTEELLAGIWSELLGRSRVRVSDDFFDLGGHSLLATRLLARIRAVFGVELDPRELFARPTLAAVAERVEDLRATGRAAAPPLQRRPSNEPAPLSFGQQRLWLLQQLTPGSPAYNMPQAIHIEGALDPAVLQASLREIVRRHEVLRTTFSTRGGEPVQVVGAVPDLVVSVLDLSGLPAAVRARTAGEVGRREMARPFDLGCGPLLRAVLLRLGATEHRLVVTVHHVASDAWSMEILSREMVALYAAFAAGKLSPLRELPLQYADFAAWQRDWLQGETLEHHLGYWRGQLAGAAPVLELPTDRPRPVLQTYRGLRRSTLFGAGLTDELRTLSRRRGATLFMTLLSAFQVLLGRLAGVRDLSVGLPVAGRDRVEIEDLVGFFVNTLVIRTDLSGDPDFVGLLDRVRRVSLDAHAHQALPFEKLVEELQPQRSLQHSPLFQVMFVLQNAPRTSHEIPGLRLRAMENDSGAAKLDLTLAMTELEGELRGDLEFNTDLFDPTTAARILEQLRTVLAAAAADPEARLSELPVLAPAAQAQLLHEWNDTEAAGEGTDCLHELFERQARENPEAEAVGGSGGSLSYRELNERANRLARHLVRLGVVPEALVGVCVERSPEMVLALLGVLKAGGAYVPLDPSYPQERLDLMVEDSGARWVLTQSRLKGFLPEAVEAVCLDEEGSSIWEESGQNLERRTDPEGLAYVIYTSGSTGRPKGVQVCHRSVLNLLRSLGGLIGAGRDTRLTALTSLSFDIAALELFLPLLHGARVDVAERELASDPRALAERLKGSGANLVQATPSTWSLLVGSGWQGSPDLQLVCGGEALSPLLASELLARCAAVWNVYGPTETTIWSTVWRVDPDRRRVLIGRPVGNTQVHLLDQELNPVPVGVGGQLYIGGLGVARGYLGRPGLTAEKFVPDPFSPAPGARLYGTGDLARRLADGSLEFLGRYDHQVKIRGFRIELGEVEAVLGKHPQVKEAVVMARRGTGEDWYLAAYVVARGEAPTASEMRRFLGLSLPDYMVPSAFVPLERLPLTPNGKVDRKALPDPDGSRPRLETVYVAPQSEKERTLVTVWQEALGIEKVGVHDNFFDLGGHSLLLVRVHEKLRISYPELQLLELFMYPTIDALARHLGGDRDRTEAVREANQVQQRIEGQDRLRKRLERGRQAAAASRKQG